MPDRIRLTELLGWDSGAVTDETCSPAGGVPARGSTAALLGSTADGPLTVDLRRDGPHALIAGTSGSGKSELLQTLVASLALGNRPTALSFVLVDYKGGSAFKDCAAPAALRRAGHRPRRHLVARALASLTAELIAASACSPRRARRTSRSYSSAAAPTRGALPRLVIVVDEFASLVEELPDFVKGVVGIGMRGRSLGVHVVLATQRPGGVVTAEIRANVNLRIALRVTDAADSTDVLDVPDAARISSHRPAGRSPAPATAS